MSAPPAAGSAFVALVLGATAMGVSPVFVRLAEVGPFASAFWRVGLALPLLYVWMRLDERGRAPGPGFSRAGVFAGFAFAGDLIFWHLAILNTTIANATFLATTMPIWVILIAAFVFKERISAPTLIGLGFCLAGGSALIGSSLQVDPARLLGDGYGLLTGVFFGLYFQAIRVGRATHGAARLTFQSSLVTAGVLFVAALIAEPRLLPAGGQGWLALAGLAFLSHVAGQGLIAVALGVLPAPFSSLVVFLEAIVAALFAYVALGEGLGALQIAGGLAIMAGIWIARPR